METNLLTFTVDLQEDGDVRTDLVYIDPKLLVDTLDEINQECHNTHILATIIRNYIREVKYAQNYVSQMLDTL